MSDLKTNTEERKRKIKMAIWMFNELIDKYPMIYEVLKRRYNERR